MKAAAKFSTLEKKKVFPVYPEAVQLNTFKTENVEQVSCVNLLQLKTSTDSHVKLQAVISAIRVKTQKFES